jgi:nitrate reductase (NAD(P)H)
VKWLNRIELSDIESQHHLHFHDNKVLPMPLGPDQTRAEKDWWYDPRFVHQVTSVICSCSAASDIPDISSMISTSTAL